MSNTFYQLLLSGGQIHDFISHEKAESCIPDKSNAVITHDFDKELYKVTTNCPMAFKILLFSPL